MLPIEITYNDCETSETLSYFINKQINSLSRINRRIVRAHVVISLSHQLTQPKQFHLTIQLALPGRDLVVTKNAEYKDGQEIYTLVRQSLKTLKQQLIATRDRSKQRRRVRHRNTLSTPA